MFAFLSDDGADEWDVFDIAVRCQGVQSTLKRAQDDVGEGSGEVDGGLEVGRWENIFAGLDRLLACCCEDTVGAERVKFFLTLDDSECFEHEVLYAVVVGFETRDVVGDVVDQRGEEGDFEELVESDQFEDGFVTRLER